MPRCRRAVLCTFLGFVAAFACSRWPFHRAVFAQSAEPGAYADILSPVEEKLGAAKFFPVADGVRIELDVIQQVPGLHAVRILSVGGGGPGLYICRAILRPFRQKRINQLR